MGRLYTRKKENEPSCAGAFLFMRATQQQHRAGSKTHNNICISYRRRRRSRWRSHSRIIKYQSSCCMRRYLREDLEDGLSYYTRSPLSIGRPKHTHSSPCSVRTSIQSNPSHTKFHNAHGNLARSCRRIFFIFSLAFASFVIVVASLGDCPHYWNRPKALLVCGRRFQYVQGEEIFRIFLWTHSPGVWGIFLHSYTTSLIQQQVKLKGHQKTEASSSRGQSFLFPSPHFHFFFPPLQGESGRKIWQVEMRTRFRTRGRELEKGGRIRNRRGSVV